MKKLFNLLALCLMAVGANAQTVIASKDWTGGFEGDYPMWGQFGDSQKGSITSDPNGVAITVGSQTGEYWQPQIQILNEGLTLEKDHSYVVKVTAKFPCSGTLQIWMGYWEGGDEYTTNVVATGGFQEVEIEFPDYPHSIDDIGFVLFQCGDFKGTTIVKKIQVIGETPTTPYNPTDICYNFIAKGKVAEVISNPKKKYRGIVEIPTSVMHDGDEYSVSKIADNAFANCHYLYSVTIPNNVISIGTSAFYNCTGLTSVTIGNSVTSIGENAFNGCESLASVNIPKSVTSIGSQAFYGCKGLASFKVESGNQYYDSRNDCNALIETATNTLLVGGNSSTIPNSVTSIGVCAFQSCTDLTSVTIPNSVTSIGSYAFYSCTGLTSVTLSSNLTIIDSYAFGGCTGLTSITIPNSVTSIGSQTFRDCTGLTSVTLSGSLTNIGAYAFGGCTGLTSINIPNSVSSIDQYAFYGCSGLTSITIPNSVTSIGNNAFQNCSGLKSISIGSGMRSINYLAFANCSELTDVYCMTEELGGNDGLITATDAFNGSYIDYATLHVPAASLNNYMNTEPWKYFQSKVAIGDGEIPETPKCAKPEISFINGKVSFSCETEGVEYISEVTLADTHKYYDSEIELSQTYKVSVYATKANYINSDVTTRDIVITGTGKAIIIGDVDGDGKVNVADHVELNNIIMEKKGSNKFVENNKNNDINNDTVMEDDI